MKIVDNIKNELLAQLMLDFDERKLSIVKHEKLYKGLMTLKMNQSPEYFAILKKREDDEVERKEKEHQLKSKWRGKK